VGLLFAFSAFNFRSAEICALNVSSRIAGYSAEENQDSCILDKKWSLRDLSRHLAISVESARLLYKDEPDVVRLSALLRKKGAPYCIPIRLRGGCIVIMAARNRGLTTITARFGQLPPNGLRAGDNETVGT